MANAEYKNEESDANVSEADTNYTKAVTGFVFESEDERLLKDANMPPLQKLMSFTQMIRRNAILKKSE